MAKIYNSSVDFRVLSNELKFVFYASGTFNNKTYNKRKCFTLTYDTQFPAEVFVKTENNSKRLFLRFKAKYVKVKKYLDPIGINKTDIVLEVFVGSNGKYSFESVKGKDFGAFLSHRNYYNPQKTSTGGVIGALKPNTGQHPIRMVLPSVGKKNVDSFSFDMDILSQYCGQYTTSLSFNCEVTDNVVIEGFMPDIIIPKQTIVPRKKINLSTVYLTLDNSDLSSGEVRYDYKKQLTKQNIPAEALELVNSQVYAIENDFKINANLMDFNLGSTNKIEIPYNISREVNQGEIKETPKVVINGKEISIIDWPSEIRNNEIFSSGNKCISLKFTNEQQQIAFSEKLKTQQIGSKETYNVVEPNGGIRPVSRVYSDISQWIKRSTLNQFNDVRFTYDNNDLIKEILICPRKKTVIGSTKSGRQNGLHTKGNELLLDGNDYIGFYHIGNNSVPYTGRSPKSLTNEDTSYQTTGGEAPKKLTFLFKDAPIQKNSNTDFCFTTNGRYGGIYSAHTTAITNTYDITISGASYSANTSLPISDFNLNNPINLIGDYTKSYRPYAFYNVYNDGLILNNSDSGDYMTYSAQSNGLYRLTYKGYLTVGYKDTKWCEYLSSVYASAMTGTYPSTDYEIKRLVNTSLINAGIGETTTALMDTGFKYYPGKRGENTNGIKGFSFVVSLIKTSSAGTETTLAEHRVLRTSDDGVANDYLKLQVTDIDKFSSASTVCNMTGTSGTTIFEYNGEVNVDTGFVNLIKGDKVQLKYACVTETTSKLGTGGTTTITVNLGHKLNDDGKESESPFFRAIKSASKVSKKDLFFDPTEASQGFEMVKGNNRRTVNLEGSLYITDNGCNTISVPKVNTQTFNNLTFIDSNGNNNILTWDIIKNRPTNKWQSLIEKNLIKDYTLKNGTIDYMTKMLKDGIFKMCLPQYDQDYKATCLYKFPQQRHSYVVVNTFKDLYGKQIINYIVITPKCGLFKPCSHEKPITSYDILHKTTPDKWKVVNVDKEITIDGKVITIVDPKTAVKPASVDCQYYCKCGQKMANKLKIDPIFGISEIMTDGDSIDCVDCVTRANNHCKKLGPSCEPVVINFCAKDGELVNEIITPGVTPIKPKGVLPVKSSDGGGTNPGPSKPITDCSYGPCRYSCGRVGGNLGRTSYDGNTGCIEDPRGEFSSYDDCEKSCRDRSGSGLGSTTSLYACVRNAAPTEKSRQGKSNVGSIRVSSACIESPQGTFKSIEDCNKVCVERKCGCRCEPGGCNPTEPTGCGKWNNWCGSGYGSGSGDGGGEIERWSCFEGLCFESEGSAMPAGPVFSSLKTCSEFCKKQVITETKDDEREKEKDEVITDEQKEKEKIDQIENPLVPEAIKEQLIKLSGSGDGASTKDKSDSSGICPKGTYFCKVINECLPNDVVCPK